MSNFYETPQSSISGANNTYWDGASLKISNPFHMMRNCVNCGSEETLEENAKTLVYINPLTYLWILISPLFLIIFYFIYRKSFKVTFSSCGQCASVKRKWRNRALLALVVCIAAFATVVSQDLSNPTIFNALMFTSIISGIFTLIAASKAQFQFKVDRLNDEFYITKGLGEGLKNILNSRRS